MYFVRGIRHGVSLLFFPSDDTMPYSSEWCPRICNEVTF